MLIAKGKTGCPVRPPEGNYLNNQTRTPIEIEIGVNIEGTTSDCKLYFFINSVLIKTVYCSFQICRMYSKKSLNYLLIYMTFLSKRKLLNTLYYLWKQSENSN